MPIIDSQKHFMCDAVLKFTISENVSQLSVLSREQMKKEVVCLLPITVAPDAHPERKANTSSDLEYSHCLWNPLANFNCAWHTLIFNAWGSPACLSVDPYIQRLFNPNWFCHTSYLKIIWDLVAIQKAVNPKIHKSHVSLAKYSVSQKRYFHVVKVGDCFRDSRRPPRQSVLLHSLLGEVIA